MAQWVKHLPTVQETQETQVRSLSWEDLLVEGMATHSNILCLENPMDRGAWKVIDHRVAKSQIRLKRHIIKTRFQKYKYEQFSTRYKKIMWNFVQYQ